VSVLHEGYVFFAFHFEIGLIPDTNDRPVRDDKILRKVNDLKRKNLKLTR
jgi:hypothetical protein